MILIDTETTGLPGISVLPIDVQPEIIEFAAVMLDNNYVEVASLHFLCRPRVLPLDPLITKITGITSDQLRDKKPFVHFLEELTDFFLGERVLVGHNLPFDRDMLAFEIKRLGRELQFPWPPKHYCTVELSMDILGKPMKQEALYEHYMGKSANQTHRALDDVRQLADIIRAMHAEGRL